jgi:signal transduction histidine kinase
MRRLPRTSMMRKVPGPGAAPDCSAPSSSTSHSAPRYITRAVRPSQCGTCTGWPISWLTFGSRAGSPVAGAGRGAARGPPRGAARDPPAPRPGGGAFCVRPPHPPPGQPRVLLAAKNIRLDVDFAPDLLWTLDEDLVIGVLCHAINNAVRYTRDRIRLTIAEHDGMLEFRVEDNGMGFPPSMLEAGASVGQGINFLTNSSGLGLFFASEVARMHKRRQRGGAIRLENGGQLGGGCFVLVLP